MADSSKTEQPTAKRQLKARQEGQFAQSRELAAATQFFVFVTFLTSAITGWLTTVKQTLRIALETAFTTDLDIPTIVQISSSLLSRIFVPLAVAAGVSGLVTLAVHLAITKMGFSFKKFTPNFNRLNPVNKIKDLARQGPVGAAQAVAMLAVFGFTAFSIARHNAEIFLSIPFATLETGLSVVASSLKDLLWKAAGVFVIFGIIDLVRQKRRFTKDLKMTKQEVKEESKENEVSPHVKGRIRRMQRDAARKRMLKEVATATAVIVNPTHFAVALRYEHKTMATPLVVAKGKNLIAARIRAIAIENGVPIVENPPLAQALYKSVDVGREIPAHLFRAVAEILAYIYKLARR
ncbi:MAG: EscU/YscU/HrcU family type III secretion system export apparatus switch protein [Acidobacteriia bacterium]|nr:EscU/YscU/HrcU family type III secretion system export apparatus switch protein [Terriglobia bacterium]